MTAVEFLNDHYTSLYILAIVLAMFLGGGSVISSRRGQ